MRIDEFVEIARELRKGSNRFFGQAPLDALRAAVRESDAAPVGERLRLRAELVEELLQQGHVDDAVTVAEEAIALATSESVLEVYPSLYLTRALAYLRKAEVENCIARKNGDCCILPLRGGGVHVEKEPAERAAADYRAYLERHPEDLEARWLLNLAAMAAGKHPDGVPERWLIPAAAYSSEAELPRFPNVAARLGLDTFNLCGGAIVDDFDGDGLLDVVTSTSDPSGPLTYYRNRGDGGFEDLSGPSRASEQLGGLNCIGADYDNDGDVDVLVLRGAWLAEEGNIRNSLLQRQDDGSFDDVTRAAGLAEPAAPSQAAVWGDFDGDGRLDLYVGNEARPGASRPSQMFRSRADGTFVDLAKDMGVTNDHFVKGVAAGDYDNDGDLDLFVANFGPDRLYRNDEAQGFRSVAFLAGISVNRSRSFASWFFDYDNDGWLDLFVSNYEATTADVAADHLGLEHSGKRASLYQNARNGTFVDVAEQVGLGRPVRPMGAGFGDLEYDGFLDIYLTTGSPDLDMLMPNVMLRNDAGRRFFDVTTAGGFGHLQKGHGVAFADLDNDGDQDLYHQLGGFYPGDEFHNAMFLNPGHGNRFLYVSLVGTKTNRAGYGARIDVHVETDEGPRRIHRAVGSVSSFGGSPTRQEIGLGAATRVRTLTVSWPVSGEVQAFEEVPLDRWIVVTEGKPELAERPLRRVDLSEEEDGR